MSLGQTRKFRIRHRETKETVTVDLEPGSLVVMSGLSQQCWVHEVPKARRITEPRINLTFRFVSQALS
jgi:alkylated DNA repair dioxygenase AlkB